MTDKVTFTLAKESISKALYEQAIKADDLISDAMDADMIDIAVQFEKLADALYLAIAELHQ